MNNSDLISVFRKLSKKDIRNLRNFVNSPFFNQREDVIQLFEFIAENIEVSATLLKKEKVYAVLFPNTKYEDAKIRYAMSFLLKNIKKYLAYTAMENDGVQEQLYLAKALQQLEHEKLFNKEWEVARKKLDVQPIRNEYYFFDQYLLFNQKYEFVSKETRSVNMPLGKTIEHLSIFYFAKILKQGCLVLAQKKFSSNDFDLTITDAVVRQLKERLDNLPPVVQIYYHSYLCMRDLEQEKHFTAFKQLMSEHGSLIPKKELRDLYLIGVNYAINQANNGKKNYIKELFELCKSGLEKDVFLQNGHLSHFLFKNVLVAGLAIGEKDWVKSFLIKYKEVLYPKNRKNFFQYCMANFYYQTQEYDKAMPILQQVEFHDILHNLGARKMLLCIYYERNEIEPLYSLLDSFSVFIRRRKKELGYHSEYFSNLIHYVKRLLKIDLTNKKKRERLKEEIVGVQRIVEKAWLLRQIENGS